jgi:hypothetical protein
MMGSVQLYELQWNGTVSNIATAAAVLFLIGWIAFCLRKFIQSVRAIRGRPDSRRQWGKAAGFLLLWIPLMLLTALAGAAASGSGDTASAAEAAGSKGALDGFGMNAQPSPWLWLAISVFTIPLLSWLTVSTGYFEPPLRLRVSPTRIELLYRLPWRDWSIPMANVTDVHLLRRDYYDPSMGHTHFYTLTLDHDGRATRIQSSQWPWYEQQIQAAYAAIKGDLSQTKVNAR